MKRVMTVVVISFALALSAMADVGILQTSVSPVVPPSGAAPFNPGQDPTGTDGIEFQTLPINIEDGCGTIILKGTNRFEGTAFIMPNAYIGRGPDGKSTAGFVKVGKDTYLLQIGVSFPLLGEPTATRTRNANNRASQCTVGGIMAKLNVGSEPPNLLVKQLGALPVNNMELWIDGVGQPYVMGDAVSTKLLDYQGQTMMAQFIVKGKDALEYLMNQIAGPVGLNLKFNVMFTARSTKNVTSVSFDVTQLITSVNASIGAKVWLIQADIQTMIMDALRQQNLKIYAEGDPNETLIQLGQQLFNKAVASGLTPTVPTADEAKQNGLNLSLPYFKVSTLIQSLKSQTSTSLSYITMGPKMVQVYTTTAILKGRIDTPFEANLELTSNNNRGEPSEGHAVPTYIEKGSVFTIAAESMQYEKVEYDIHKSYFSREDLASLKDIVDHFEILSWDARAFDTMTTIHGNIAFAWKRRLGLNPALPNWSLFGPFDYTHYFWGKSEQKPTFIQTDMRAVSYVPEDIAAIQLTFTFSGLGGKFKLSNLAQSNEYWDSYVDETSGRVVVRARAELGRIYITNETKYRTGIMAKQWYFQETWDKSKVTKVRFEDVLSMPMPLDRTTIRVHFTASDGPVEIKVSTPAPSPVKPGHVTTPNLPPLAEVFDALRSQFFE